jgi:hypothetical protein
MSLIDASNLRGRQNTAEPVGVSRIVSVCKVEAESTETSGLTPTARLVFLQVLNALAEVVACPTRCVLSRIQGTGNRT